MGVFAQAWISAAAAFAGSVSTDFYDNSQSSSYEESSKKSVGQILLRGVGSAAISFGGSIFGSALGKIPTKELKSAGENLILRGNVAAKYLKPTQARTLIGSGNKLVNTANGISSVVGTIFTWPTATVLTYGAL